MTTLTFLGSGGGRFAMITQIKGTGGFRLDTENFHIHIDPGPGALIKSLKEKLNPQKLNCIIVTHAHTDHCTDTAPLIEAMCGGMLHERGTLIASKSITETAGDVGPVLSKYHYSKPKKFITPKYGDIIELEEAGEKLEIEIIKCNHADPTTFGMKMRFGNKKLGYTSDTEYFEELGELYKGCDILIINSTRPGAERIPGHLCTEDTIKVLKIAKPKLAILYHIGIKLINAGLQNEVQRIKQESGVDTIAAEDGLKVNVEDVLSKFTQTSLGKF